MLIHQSDHHHYTVVHTTIPQDPHPLLIQELGLNGNSAPLPLTPAPADPVEFEYPVILPGHPFSFKSIASCSRVPLSQDEVNGYRHNPDLIHNFTFVSATAKDGTEAFQVSAILAIAKEKLFYLVFADEGPEAVSYSYKDFFELLATSE